MIALGIDPGFANIGWSLVDVTTTSEKVLACGVITTEPSNKKRGVRAASDNIRRVREIRAALLNDIRGPGGLTIRNAVVACIEEQSWPRGASAAIKTGMGHATVICVCDELGIPILEAGTIDIKDFATGKKSASKEEVIDALKVRKGYAALKSALGRVPKGKHEHIADACGAVGACRSAETMTAMLRLEGV